MTFESYVPCAFAHTHQILLATPQGRHIPLEKQWVCWYLDPHHQCQPTSSSSPGQWVPFYGSSLSMFPPPQSVNSWGLGCGAHQHYVLRERSLITEPEHRLLETSGQWFAFYTYFIKPSDSRNNAGRWNRLDFTWIGSHHKEPYGIRRATTLGVCRRHQKLLWNNRIK